MHTSSYSHMTNVYPWPYPAASFSEVLRFLEVVSSRADFPCKAFASGTYCALFDLRDELVRLNTPVVK